MLNPDTSKMLVYLARKCISSLVEQVVDGTVSVGEWHAMVMDVKDIICTMLQEGKYEHKN